MRSTKDLMALFQIPADKPELNAAHLQALSTKVPLMYSFLILNLIGCPIPTFPMRHGG